MTIKQYQKLQPIDRFTILIKRLKKENYINNDGIIINIFTEYDVINKELNSFGISTKNKTIDEILQEIVNSIYIETALNFISSDFKKLVILKNYVIHLGFFIYDYNIKKMPKNLKDEYKEYNEYSLFFKNKNLLFRLLS